MKTVLLDFNGTLFFDTGFHMEAWSKIYQELTGKIGENMGPEHLCGPRNEDIINSIKPGLTREERDEISARKEALYRKVCVQHQKQLKLVAGVEEFLDYLVKNGITFTLASASIMDNINFYFETFGLDRWFDKESIVYDDGTYPDKGAMHVEAAKRLNTSIERCVVIEDSTYAISLTKDYGASTIIGIGSRSVHPDLIRSGATYCIEDFTQIDMSWLKD